MKQWFFIHTYSGHENKVVESLHARIRDMELGEQITEVLWPAGYTATKEANGLVLRDEKGAILVHEGERVEMSGGLGANEIWVACAGSIREISSVGG